MSNQPIPLDPVTFPLHGSRLIEASAGTGKTYTITALYVRLVLECQLSPEQILVVTFTEAATEELRDRIRATLSEAASYFRDSSATTDKEYLADLRNKIADIERAAQQLEHAALNMDEAAVHTIHGWCNRMLREHAFASGSLFTQQLNTDTKAHWQTAADDYWRTFIAPLEAVELPIYMKFIGEFSSPEALYDNARKLIAHIGDEALVSPKDVITQGLAREQQIIEQFHSLPWGEWATEVAEIIERLRATKGQISNARQLMKASVEKWVAQLQQWQFDIDNNCAALIPALKPESGWQRLTTEGMQAVLSVPLPEHPLWQAMTDFQHELAQLQSPKPQLLKHAAQWIRMRFQHLQQQRAEMGFDDMLTRLRAALLGDQGTMLGRTIREQFPVAMIDEFQDTDQVQYDIFDKVYEIENTSDDEGVFLIGDPKQAIYSFRNADIFTYLKAREATAGRHYTLATNFRSTTAMVNASNALFLQAKDYKRGAFLFRDPATNVDPIPFIEVQANGLKKRYVEAGKEPAAVQLEVLIPQEKKPKDTDMQRAIARRTAAQIVSILSDERTGFEDAEGSLNRVKPSDIAILVSSAKEAKLVRDALRERSLASVYLSDRDSVFASDYAIDLVILLQACANPREPALLRAALSCSILGLSLHDINEYLHNEVQWDAFAEQILHYHERWQRFGILAMLQRILHDYEVPKRLLQRENGERQLTDILHLTELLQQQSAQTEGMSGLLRYLSEHIELAQSENNRTDAAEQQVRLESDSELIQVITIHKSKGLQYPLVFLPFISNVWPKMIRVSYPTSYHDEQGQLQFVLDKDDKVGIEKADQERLAEDIRKLYVAVTRAQYATYIGAAPFREFKNTALNYLLSGDFDSAIELQNLVAPPHCEVIHYHEEKRQDLYQPPAAAVRHFNYCQMPASHRLQPWWVASYSALKYGEWVAADDTLGINTLEGWHEDQTAPDEQEIPTPNTIHDFPKGAEPGTFLHNLLEDAAEEGFAQLAETTEGCTAVVVARTQMAPWLEYRETLVNWLQSYLTTSLPLQDTSVSLAQLRNYQAEPEFWFAANAVQAQQLDQLVRKHLMPEHDRPRVLPMTINGMLKGFIDLVFEHDGKYYVADYKSNYLGANASYYSQTAMRDKVLASRYDLQYVIYTLALHKLLQARLGDTYDYDTHVGGAVYLFLRGFEADTGGAFFDRPSRELIESLAALFDTEMTTAKEATL